jgi:hypothetical protein
MQIVPGASNKFKNTDPAFLYFEVYEPLLSVPDRKEPLAVGVAMKVIDSKSGDKKVDSGWIRIPLPEKAGSPILPIGLKLPVTGLAPGTYQLEMTAVDQTDKPGKTVIRSTFFDIQ